MALWAIDDYWYYSLFTLFMLVTFESTVVMQRQRNLKELRSLQTPKMRMQVGGSRAAPRRTTPLHIPVHRTAPHRTAPHRTAPHRTTPLHIPVHRTAPHHSAAQHSPAPCTPPGAGHLQAQPAAVPVGLQPTMPQTLGMGCMQGHRASGVALCPCVCPWAAGVPRREVVRGSRR